MEGTKIMIYNLKISKPIQKSNIVDEKVLLVIIIASMLIMIQGSIKRKKKEEPEPETQQSFSEIVDSQIEKK